MTIEQFIEKHESRRRKPYLCPAGKNTIGVGWNMDSHPLPKDIADYLKEHGAITDNMIDYLLMVSISIAISDCKKLFHNFEQFSDNRRMALIDFLFQLGFTKAKKFVKSIGYINQEQWALAAANLARSIWYEQTPKRAEEICKLVEVG